MASEQPKGSRFLRREAGIIGLLFASVTSVIGSGWLFGPLQAATIAGPLSVWSWIIGGIIVLLIALCFSELGAMFPRSGALVHMSHASHGQGLGRIWAWLLYLSYAAIPAVEAEAVVTYANNYLPYFIRPHTNGMLSLTGYIACAILLGIFCLINLFTIKKLLAINSAMTWFKIGVPVLTIVVFFLYTIPTPHWNVWHAAPGTFKPVGMYTAIPLAGIVFSYLGFRSAIDLGGESKRPGRDIPIAVIGSVLISAAIYILLQIVFINALQPQDLAKGWTNLTFAGSAGPFAGLAAIIGVGWLATLLYIDSFISPSGTGLMYTTAGARVLFAAGETNSGPQALTKLTKSSQVPWVGILIMWIVGILFILPFPAWQLLVGYITSVTVLTYGLGPITLMVLRRSRPDAPRKFKLWIPYILAPLAFICSDLIIYWTGFDNNNVMFIILVVGFIAYAIYYHLIAKNPPSKFGWKGMSWLLPWFGGLWILSYVSDLGNGLGLIGFWLGVIIVTLWSIVIMGLALWLALPAAETKEIMDKLEQTL